MYGYIVGGRKRKRVSRSLWLWRSAKPVIEYMKGWKEDISHVRNFPDLPEEAQEYVRFVEKSIGCPITYISVGPERDSIIIRK